MIRDLGEGIAFALLIAVLVAWYVALNPPASAPKHQHRVEATR